MNRRMRKQRYIWLSLFAAAAAAAILGIAFLIAGSGSMSVRALWRNVKNLTRERTTTTEFWYNSAGDCVFAPVGGGFVLAGSDGVRYLDSSGLETQLSAEHLSSPAADSSGDAALVYDLGGRFLCVSDKRGMVWSGEAEGSIYAASINDAGWITVCAEETGYKGAVTVYNASGRAVYRWHSGSGYVIGADLSSSCKTLAVLSLGSDGSRISFFRLSSEEELSRYVLPDEVILEVAFLSPDTVAAVTQSSVITVSSDGSEKNRTDLPAPHLTHCTFDGEGFTTLACTDYAVGTHGGIVTVDDHGKLLGQLAVDRQILSLSAAGRYVAVRYADGITVYTPTLKPVYETEGMVDAITIMTHTDGSFIAAGEYSAEIYGK